MQVVNIKEKSDYLREYIKLCSIEWGEKKSKKEMEEYILKKEQRILNDEKVISVLGLISKETLVGFISLFKYEDDYKDLTPWYATMYVKKEYRKRGYSKILNDALLKEAKKLGYNKVYLKTNLVNYYEKFGAKFVKTLDSGEKLLSFRL